MPAGNKQHTQTRKSEENLIKKLFLKVMIGSRETTRCRPAALG